MRRALKVRLYPTTDQKKYLDGLFGAVRFCFNKGLALKIHYYRVKGVNLTLQAHLWVDPAPNGRFGSGI